MGRLIRIVFEHESGPAAPYEECTGRKSTMWIPERAVVSDQ
jgi:hypothetical protein